MHNISSAYNNRKLYTNPINPDTSTNENPINAHLIKLLLIDGLREIEKSKNANIKPTPIAQSNAALSINTALRRNKRCLIR